MTVAIIILAYVANIFFNRWLTYLAVKNQGKGESATYGNGWLWFIPAVGTGVCILDWVHSLAYKKSGSNNCFNWFNGKNW